MLIQYALVVSVSVTVARLAAGGAGGWLGRLVQYHREAFLKDYERFDTHMVNIDASVEAAPRGYSDPPGWDEQSVLRLLALVDHTRTSSMKPVKVAIRRALRPTRRYMPYIPPGMSSHNLFPSLSGNIPNFIYNDYSYETTSEEIEERSEERERRERDWERRHSTRAVVYNATDLDHVAVLVVRNPVEARLPSARISVNLLRKIMEQRALAARVLTPSTRRTLTWRRRMNTTRPAKKATTTTTTTTTSAPAATDGGGDDKGKDAGDDTKGGNEPTTGASATNAGGGGGGEAAATDKSAAETTVAAGDEPAGDKR